MRSSKSRSRSKSNRNRNNNSLGNVVNRVFDSNGPEGKVRGTPQQIIDKYNQLARDAWLGNDRVAAENFQQHAEHYLRLLGEAQREQDQRREQQERENRERQAQRDREKAERDTQRQQEGGTPAAAEVTPDPAMAEQPDVLSFDLSGDDDGPGIVDTPESKAERKEPAAAAEPAEKKAEEKPKKPRAPRKPRKKPETEAKEAAEPQASAEAAEAPADASSEAPQDAAE